MATQPPPQPSPSLPPPTQPQSLPKLSKKALLLILVFTIIEVVTLTAWDYFLGIPINAGLASGGVAAIVLFIGLLVEHTVAAISNKV